MYHVNLNFPIIILSSTTDRTTTGMAICKMTEDNNSTISKGKGKEWDGTISKELVKIEGDRGISITIISTTIIMVNLGKKIINIRSVCSAFFTNAINEFDEM